MTLTVHNVDQGCSVEGCDRKRRTRGWCSSHYNKWHTTGIEPTRPFTDEARFWKFVHETDPSKCWEWQSVRNAGGYGKFWLNGRTDIAHRVSYRMSHGPIPAGLQIRHTCDNPPCVNPAHLITGTAKENAGDALDRDHYLRGTSNPRAKLSVQQVDEIRRCWPNESQVSMARRFGVSKSAVQWVLYGKSWVGIGETS